MKTDERKAIISRLVTSIIFGSAFVFSKDALTYLTPVQLLSYRFLLATIFMFSLKSLRLINVSIGLKQIIADKHLLIIAAVQPFAGYFFEMQGLKRLSAAESGIMLAVIPILVTVLGILTLGERPNWIQILFLIISFIGVIFILFVKGTSTSQLSNIGGIFILLAAFCSAIQNVMSRSLANKYTFVDITYAMMAFGAFSFSCLNAMEWLILKPNTPYIKLLCEPDVWISVLYLGILSSVVGFLLTNYSLSKMTAFRVSIFNNLATLIAIIVAVVARGDTYTFLQVIGTSMIVVSVWGVNYFAPKAEIA